MLTVFTVILQNHLYEKIPLGTKTTSLFVILVRDPRLAVSFIAELKNFKLFGLLNNFQKNNLILFIGGDNATKTNI